MAKITLNTNNRSDTYEFDETYEQVTRLLTGSKTGFVELHSQGQPRLVNRDVVVQVFPTSAPAAMAVEESAAPATQLHPENAVVTAPAVQAPS